MNRYTYPLDPENVRVGDWVDYDWRGEHHHEKVSHVTPGGGVCGLHCIQTRCSAFTTPSEYEDAVFSRENQPERTGSCPIVPTEPGFYRDNDGDMWKLTEDGVWMFKDYDSYIEPMDLKPNDYLPFTPVNTDEQTTPPTSALPTTPGTCRDVNDALLSRVWREAYDAGFEDGSNDMWGREHGQPDYGRPFTTSPYDKES